MKKIGFAPEERLGEVVAHAVVCLAPPHDVLLPAADPWRKIVTDFPELLGTEVTRIEPHERVHPSHCVGLCLQRWLLRMVAR